MVARMETGVIVVIMTGVLVLTAACFARFLPGLPLARPDLPVCGDGVVVFCSLGLAGPGTASRY